MDCNHCGNKMTELTYAYKCKTKGCPMENLTYTKEIREPGKADLYPKEPLTGFPWLIYLFRCIWEVKPELIAVTGYILAFIFVIMLVWIATSIH